jgi:hypothetical protein
MSAINIYDYSRWSKKILVYQLDAVYGFVQARLESLHIGNLFKSDFSLDLGAFF